MLEKAHSDAHILTCVCEKPVSSCSAAQCFTTGDYSCDHSEHFLLYFVFSDSVAVRMCPLRPSCVGGEVGCTIG